MRLITRVSALEENLIVADVETDAQSFFFSGHFPDMPIMPGVMITEAIGQAGALLACVRDKLDTQNNMMAFTGFEQAKFRRMVKPEEPLYVSVKIEKNRRTLYKFRGEAKIDQELVASVGFSASLVPR